MKKFYAISLTVLSLCSFKNSNAQCNGIKGPNLLGAKGTFSTQFITVNSAADYCTRSGSGTNNPIGNIGSALLGCSTPGVALPCSDYTYTAKNGGLDKEFTYTLIKTIGNSTGGNCIKGDWVGKDHTNDGGYFMAVNGAPANTYSNIFYKIKNIQVCVGATYEFSAWVINLLPASSPSATAGSEPSISFKVNGQVIANSGTIAYNNSATWVRVSGSFVATTSTVELQVVNATSVAIGNDLGLDDISFNSCGSQIAVDGPVVSNIGENVAVNFVVTDNSLANTWYKWQKSTDGGSSFSDITTGNQAAFNGNNYSLAYNLGIINALMNGNKYRLVVSTSQAGLSSPSCNFFNDYTLIASAAAGPLPVKLTSFTGRYSEGKAQLEWQTSQEMNSDHFELYKSTNGLDFVKVANIKSAGNSNTIKKYSYQDNSGNSGNNVYYRLKQVDIDGKAALSSVVKLSLGSKTSVDIFPNPFGNNFTLSFGAGKTSTASLSIQNSAGSMVYSKIINVIKGNNSVLMNNLPSLGAGVYYIKVYNEELNFNGKLQKL